MQHKICSQCLTKIICGSDEKNCWCMVYEPISAIEEGKDCLCEACLKKILAKEATKVNKPVIQEEDYYIENGFYVFTERYHLKRGTCCKNGCRHCPY